jgi:hypothetical protein
MNVTARNKTRLDLDVDLGFYVVLILEVLTNVSEEPTASSFWVGSSESLVNASNITWRIDPEDQHLNFYRHENFNLIKAWIYLDVQTGTCYRLEPGWLNQYSD